jgi:hypothetical protein
MHDYAAPGNQTPGCLAEVPEIQRHLFGILRLQPRERLPLIFVAQPRRDGAGRIEHRPVRAGTSDREPTDFPLRVRL